MTYIWMGRLSADGSLGTANTTNLAIKGIVGVKAMSEISRALGNETDAEKYGVSVQPFFTPTVVCLA